VKQPAWRVVMAIVNQHPAQEILVPTDFSASADAALAVAGQYARRLRGHIHLLHVSAAAGTDAVRSVAAVQAKAGPDVPIIVAGGAGDPAEEILRYAWRHAVDLIVMGTHGRTGVSRLLLGSVAERVVRGARCPVLVVPAPRQIAAPAASAPSGVATEEDEAEQAVVARPCLVCATPTRDLICEPCRARIRGEALERKHREERAGRL
jgi:nucleotide-binding universal stress UspA family protein